MSPFEHFVRLQKHHTDRAIGQVYARLTGDGSARAAFSELLLHVRLRGKALLQARVIDGQHPGVEALYQLARCADSYIRPLSKWSGCASAWRPSVHALAQHLLARYPVPRFLASAWYDAGGPLDDAKRRWFVEHGAGTRFRSLDLPIAMTSRMEHVFLHSREHLSIEQALRRAELIGLGMPDPLVRAVLATRVGSDFRNAEFWRSVWYFMIAHADAIEPQQVGPMVDFLHAIRHECVGSGTEPAQPAFSIKGRTPRSVFRLVDDWHRGLGRVYGAVSWRRHSRVRPMTVLVPRQDEDAPPLRYEFVELTDTEQLRAEGAALHHCVATYSGLCVRGTSRIWSLRSTLDERTRSVMTIEIDPARHAIVQARGYRNRLPTGRMRQLIADWAARERMLLKY